MQTLRMGSKGDEVERWQYFLRGVGLYFGAVDGIFGKKTQHATQEFQRRHALLDDGIAGNRTLGEAMRLGFAVISDDPSLPDTLDWPANPDFPPLGEQGRALAFGQFTFEPAPTPGNPEAIRIASSWVAENIRTVQIPQLVGVLGAPASGQVQFHERVAPKVVELFARWQDAGLLGLVLTWGGSFASRFVRGSRSVLSPHAHGSAFDINVAWNGFGAIPARTDAKGSVRRLVPIANELGFYWGGHFTKPDGMHIELARI